MRILMWFSMGFAGACGLGAYLWVDNTALLFALGFGILGILGIFLRKQRFHGQIAAVLLGLAVGLCWFRVYDGVYLNPIRQLDGQTVPITVTAAEFSRDTDYGSQVDGWITYGQKPYKVRLYLRGQTAISPGAVVQTEAKLRMTSDGGQSEPTYHRSDGIFLVASQTGTGKITEASKLPWYGFPAVIRQKALEQLEQNLPERQAAFAQALLLGVRQELDYETRTALRVTGVQHLVAVSGLHVSILFGLLCMLTGRRRWLLFLLGTPILVLFAAVAGFTPSVTRAVVMQMLILLANLVNREYDPPTALASAVLLMLGFNPLVVASVGFQLSVACVIGIFLFSDSISKWLLHPGRLGRFGRRGILARMLRWVSTTVGVSVGATIMTTPLVAVYFGTISLAAILTNLLVLWCITGVFYGLLLICAAGMTILPLAKLVGAAVSLLIDYVCGVCIALSKFPLAAVYTKSVYIVVWLIFCYVLLAVFLLHKNRRPVVLLCCGIIGLCMALLASWWEAGWDNYRVTVLDVGQGQCILVQSEGNAYLVDCGGFSDTGVADLAAETLLSQGITRLDGLVLTHGDRDHAGAAGNFLTRIPADTLYVPGKLQDTWPNVANTIHMGIHQDMHLVMDQGSLTILAPEVSGSDNAGSLGVLFQYGDWDLLVMGDRAALEERMLLRRVTLPEIEVLVVGHHGSRTSTCPELLEAAHPKTAVISVGEGNRYGHPTQEVLDRLAEFGCTVCRTDQDGTIIFRG